MAIFEHRQIVFFNDDGSFDQIFYNGTETQVAGLSTPQDGTFEAGDSNFFGSFTGFAEFNGIQMPVFTPSGGGRVLLNPSFASPDYSGGLGPVTSEPYVWYNGYFNYGAAVSFAPNVAGGFTPSVGDFGAILDQDGDLQFETGDDIPADGFVPPVTYLGTADYNGDIVPVYQLGIIRIYYIPPTQFYTILSAPPPINSGADFAFCFAEGTGIATPSGEVAVEDLRIGDRILTADGTQAPVKWVGRQTILKAFARSRAQMVRIGAGTLGTHADLTVTADHGMVVDGLVINAGALVGLPGVALVAQAELPDRFTVYHVETEAHDVIVANGAAAETFIDYAGRAAFDNHAEYIARYGVERILPEMDRPRISTQRLVPPEIRARLYACFQGGQTDIRQSA